MIVDVRKYLIVGVLADIDQFFKRAQEKGVLEFVSPHKSETHPLPASIQNYLKGIKILREYPIFDVSKDPSFHQKEELLDEALADRVITLKENIEKLSEEKLFLEQEIIRISPLGNFSMEEIRYLQKEGHRLITFFCMKSSKNSIVPADVFYISSEYDLDYFMAITEKPLTIPGMIEMRVDLSTEELKDRLEIVQNSLHSFEEELKSYTRHLELLTTRLVEEFNTHNLNTAKKTAAYPLDNSLFIAEAWVPRNKLPQLHHIIKGMDLYVEPIKIEATDRVPTYFENKGIDLIGEELIKIYDVPAVSDKDPSRWVFWFFSLFFAIIVGDAGYGLIFLALAYYLKKRVPNLKAEQKQFLKLFFSLSFSCIIWGVLTSAYFGIHLAPDNKLQSISPLHYLVEKKASYHLAKQDDVYHLLLGKYPSIQQARTGNEMLSLASVQKKKIVTYPIVEDFSSSILLEFTLIVGIAHLATAFFRYLNRNVAGLGWIIFMIGGYLFFPSLLHATTIIEFSGLIDTVTSTALGIQCLYGGIGFAIIAAFIQHRLKGLNEIAHTIQVFADILSYLRLYALNLAGSIIAATFNQEGSAFGLFFGLIIITFGHLLNIFLAFMGGIIHGLRLNFLEWYHYCFEGGGRLFNPLQKIKNR